MKNPFNKIYIKLYQLIEKTNKQIITEIKLDLLFSLFVCLFVCLFFYVEQLS